MNNGATTAITKITSYIETVIEIVIKIQILLTNDASCIMHTDLMIYLTHTL